MICCVQLCTHVSMAAELPCLGAICRDDPNDAATDAGAARDPLAATAGAPRPPPV